MLEIGETFLCFLKTASSYFNHFNVMEHLLLNVQNIQSGTQISVLLMKTMIVVMNKDVFCQIREKLENFVLPKKYWRKAGEFD